MYQRLKTLKYQCMVISEVILIQGNIDGCVDKFKYCDQISSDFKTYFKQIIIEDPL